MHLDKICYRTLPLKLMIGARFLAKMLFTDRKKKAHIKVRLLRAFIV